MSRYKVQTFFAIVINYHLSQKLKLLRNDESFNHYSNSFFILAWIGMI